MFRGILLLQRKTYKLEVRCGQAIEYTYLTPVTVTSLTVLSRVAYYPIRLESTYSPLPLGLVAVSAVVHNDWTALVARPRCQSGPRLIGAAHYFCNFGYVFSPGNVVLHKQKQPHK